jgi:hypothetical protein
VLKFIFFRGAFLEGLLSEIVDYEGCFRGELACCVNLIPGAFRDFEGWLYGVLVDGDIIYG